MRSENMYRVLVATIFVLLMVVGLYIGVEISDDGEVQEVKVSNTDSVKIYDEVSEEEPEEVIEDIDVVYTDIYPECGHNIESKEHQSKTTKDIVKKEIEEKDLGYRLVGEKEGVLLYQKVHTGKCMNHYKVCLENDVVHIYRMSETSEFEHYQETEITSSMLRDGIREQLEAGIIVDDIEELFLLMEDIES